VGECRRATQCDQSCNEDGESGLVSGCSERKNSRRDRLHQSQRDASSATTRASTMHGASDSAQSNLLQIRLGRCSLTLLTFYTEGSVRTAYVVHYNQRGSREPPAAAHEGNERVVGRHPRCPIRQYSIVGTTNGCSGQRRLAFDYQVPTQCNRLVRDQRPNPGASYAKEGPQAARQKLASCSLTTFLAVAPTLRTTSPCRALWGD
jgi:hypothetical protein